MSALLAKLNDWRVFQANKHRLSDDPDQWAVDHINSLSNFELLNEISEALDQLEQERDTCK